MWSLQRALASETFCCSPQYNLSLEVTKDDGKKKPAIYRLYDFTKGGTDVMDHKIGACTCKAKSNRRILTAFSYILDVCRINTSTILAFNEKMDLCK